MLHALLRSLKIGTPCNAFSRLSADCCCVHADCCLQHHARPVYWPRHQLGACVHQPTHAVAMAAAAADANCERGDENVLTRSLAQPASKSAAFVELDMSHDTGISPRNDAHLRSIFDRPSARICYPSCAPAAAHSARPHAVKRNKGYLKSLVQGLLRQRVLRVCAHGVLQCASSYACH